MKLICYDSNVLHVAESKTCVGTVGFIGLCYHGVPVRLGNMLLRQE
jgi:hypothetical protein